MIKIDKKATQKQDQIFKKMSADKKLRLASKLTFLCLKLNNLNGNHRSTKIPS